MGAMFRWLRALYQSKVALGQRVNRASATLPQAAAAAIFNIVGGRVLLTSIVGQIEVVIAAVAPAVNVNTKLTATPTTGTARDICAILDINAYVVGDQLGITGINTDAMLPPASAGTIEGMTVKGVVLKEGTLDLDCAQANTGEISWVVHYIPIDEGAVVQAA